MDMGERRLEIVRHVLVELVMLLFGDLDFDRAHSAEAWLICSSSPVDTCSRAVASHCSFFIRMGMEM